MFKYIVLFFSLIVLIACSDKELDSIGDNKMNLSQEEKLKIITDAGNSDDIKNASKIAGFLGDQDEKVVSSACFYLGYLGARDYLEEMIGFLSQDDEDILNLCLSGIALVADQRDERFSDVILPFASHESMLVRMSAVEALGSIKSIKALSVLQERFSQEALAVQYEIVRALGKIGDLQALPLLTEYLKEVKAMDLSVPRKGGTRGSAPHPDVLEIVTTQAISALQ